MGIVSFTGRRFSRWILGGGLGLTLVLGSYAPAGAIGFDFFDRGVTGNFDTTVTVGAAIRAQERSGEIIGINNGGSAFSINGDDGNLNWDEGEFTSLNGRVTHELDMRWNDAPFLDRLGLFARGYYFYDAAIMQIGPERTPIRRQARRYRSGWDADLLDYFLDMELEVADRWVNLRVGSQVINWGESTFIQNGINVINHIDVTQLRAAGSELRNALLPIPAVDLTIALTNNLSVEGFYQLYWDHTEIEPLGTFFSTSDIASPGADRVFLGFGLPPVPRDHPPTPVGWCLPPSMGGTRGQPGGCPSTASGTGLAVPRADEVEADHMGQGGVAVRYFSPTLNDTEFGLYYVRYHSRLPVISGRTGDLQSFINGDYASSGQYFREFPEDIDMVGTSFSTEVGWPGVGIAIQGEASYKFNQPLQVDDVELLLSALSPLDQFVSGVAQIDGEPLPPGTPVFGQSQLGAVDPLSKVTGFRRKEVFQWQYTVTGLLGPTFGSNQLVMLGEMGGTWVPDLEDKDELRYEGPGTYTSGNPFFTNVFIPTIDRTIQPATETNGFADEFSWGYRLAARFDYLNAIRSINLFPTLAFQHDVDGTTPSPILNFVDDRKAFTARLRATYLENTQAAIGYTFYFGGGRYNLIHDRDFIELSLSYYF